MQSYVSLAILHPVGAVDRIRKRQKDKTHMEYGACRSNRSWRQRARKYRRVRPKVDAWPYEVQRSNEYCSKADCGGPSPMYRESRFLLEWQRPLQKPSRPWTALPMMIVRWTYVVRIANANHVTLTPQHSRHAGKYGSNVFTPTKVPRVRRVTFGSKP